ncbi:hypothetical protein EVAR_8145_1 [Eumeta japonica]|uniref:Uncharacterized protein n=1 Tax=Eumeta variegata TaxID=151549 RepID=A0A4C1TSU1_EUMVA|nr:hypothetical protein EVAR_8145_1 [Eumeta japonica]
MGAPAAACSGHGNFVPVFYREASGRGLLRSAREPSLRDGFSELASEVIIDIIIQTKNNVQRKKNKDYTQPSDHDAPDFIEGYTRGGLMLEGKWMGRKRRRQLAGVVVSIGTACECNFRHLHACGDNGVSSNAHVDATSRSTSAHMCGAARLPPRPSTFRRLRHLRDTCCSKFRVVRICKGLVSYGSLGPPLDRLPSFVTIVVVLFIFRRWPSETPRKRLQQLRTVTPAMTVGLLSKYCFLWISLLACLPYNELQGTCFIIAGTGHLTCGPLRAIAASAPTALCDFNVCIVVLVILRGECKKLARRTSCSDEPAWGARDGLINNINNINRRGGARLVILLRRANTGHVS